MDFFKTYDEIILNFYTIGAYAYQITTGREFNKDKYNIARILFTGTGICAIKGILTPINVGKLEEELILDASNKFLNSLMGIVSGFGQVYTYYREKLEYFNNKFIEDNPRFLSLYTFNAGIMVLLTSTYLKYIDESSELVTSLLTIGIGTLLAASGLYINRTNIPPPERKHVAVFNP